MDIKVVIREALHEVVPDIDKTYSVEEKRKLEKTLILVQEKFTNSSRYLEPIPSPQTLMHYSEIISDGAERIIKLAECQTEHCRGLETKLVASKIKQKERGQTYVFVLAIVLFVCGMVAFLTGHDGVSGTVFAVTVIGLSTVFAVGKRE